jgi:transcriptional regulator with XRE-family HTH domain
MIFNDNNMTNTEIIKMLKDRKDVLGINQVHLAELSKIGVATLRRFESGKGNITLNNLQKIADVLGLEIRLEPKKPNQ